MPLGALLELGAAERDALVDGAVVADLRRLADDDTHAVVDEDTPADLRAGVDLDAGEETRQMRGDAAEPRKAGEPASTRPAVHEDRMQARITGQHLPSPARSGVALTDAGDVFSEAVEHGERSVEACAIPCW
jgi:hypothetical protein